MELNNYELFLRKNNKIYRIYVKKYSNYFKHLCAKSNFFLFDKNLQTSKRIYFFQNNFFFNLNESHENFEYVKCTFDELNGIRN